MEADTKAALALLMELFDPRSIFPRLDDCKGTHAPSVKRIKELAALERIGDRPVIEDQKFREKLAAFERGE